MKKNNTLYLDYASTTPVDQRVMEEMRPWFTETFGNAASRTHEYGWTAEKAVSKARDHVASLINAKAQEIVFTSGSTEGINFILKGLVEKSNIERPHIITCQTEHKAVLDVCKYLEIKNAQVTYLSVDQNGLIDLNELESSINDSTILVSIMHGNNETGVIQPITEIGEICMNKSCLFMTDATQSVGKVSVDVQKSGIDLLVMSGHKFGGPKGVGAVFIKDKYPSIQIEPLLHGGGHESGFRSGTLNVPGIVGLGKAAEIAAVELNLYKDLEKNKQLFEARIKEEGFIINGEESKRLSTISNILIPDIDSEALIMNIREQVAVANGSACTSAEVHPSHVLQAMGLSSDESFSSIRCSFHHSHSEDEFNKILELLIHSKNTLNNFIL